MDTQTSITNTIIQYNGRKVTAKKLVVSSTFPINIESAWQKVQTPELLEFICKGRILFKPITGEFPQFCKEGDSTHVFMYLYGFIPFGGIHTLHFETVDSQNHIIQSQETNRVTKIWNHKITMDKVDDQHITYEDEVIIYAGAFTDIVSWWAKSFYKYRHKRWLLVATENRNELAGFVDSDALIQSLE